MAPKSREQRFQDHTADNQAAQDALGGDNRLVDTPTWQIQIAKEKALRRQSERSTIPSGHRPDSGIVFGSGPFEQGPIDSIFRLGGNKPQGVSPSIETSPPFRRRTRLKRTSG